MESFFQQPVCVGAEKVLKGDIESDEAEKKDGRADNDGYFFGIFFFNDIECYDDDDLDAEQEEECFPAGAQQAVFPVHDGDAYLADEGYFGDEIGLQEA